MNIKRRRFIAIAAAAGVSAALIKNISFADEGLYRWSGVVMDADASIQLYHPKKGKARELVEESLHEIIRLEKLFSVYEPNSLVSELNREGYLDNPEEEFVTLLRDAQNYSGLTDGAFDITVQPLWQLYKQHFGKSNNDISDGDVLKVLSLVDYRKLEISSKKIELKNPGMQITLNGIAQGYITDKVTDLLQARGIKNVLVELGESRALGRHPDGASWNVGIRNPDRLKEVIEDVRINNMAVATSGGYGTVFDREGKHHHLFDPKTGKSANYYKSVSVIAPRASMSDALSTSFFVMPKEKTFNVIDKMSGVSGIFVMNDGRVIKRGRA